ncbi:MAG: hypothetical protein GY841_00740 [FCB group bacterium]|nr:hypothetical protein [FCB group bacterium]
MKCLKSDFFNKKQQTKKRIIIYIIILLTIMLFCMIPSCAVMGAYEDSIEQEETVRFSPYIPGSQERAKKRLDKKQINGSHKNKN